MITINEYFAGACIVFIYATAYFVGKEVGFAEGWMARVRYDRKKAQK